jgi:hypothetical protein
VRRGPIARERGLLFGAPMLHRIWFAFPFALVAACASNNEAEPSCDANPEAAFARTSSAIKIVNGQTTNGQWVNGTLGARIANASMHAERRFCE